MADDTQGVQFATMQQLARYWGTDYDWRKCQAKLNSVPQFVTEIDGLDVHFIHVRSKEPECSSADYYAWVARFDYRADEGHRSADESNGTRRECIGFFRRGDSFAAGLRFFREAHCDRLGPQPHRKSLDHALS